MKKLIPFLIVCLVSVYACDKKETTKTQQKSDTAPKKTITDTISVLEPKENLSGFPATGNKASDFVSSIYEIQYEAEGDLNQDGLSDKALVLRKKADTLAARTMLIILKKTDKTYRLSKVSSTVLPDQYDAEGYEIHDPEDISIEKGELKIILYNIGPNGNLFSHFKYVNNDFLLTYIETYNMGAGSHQSLYYEPMKGKFIQEVTNTQEENNPVTTKTFHVKKENYRFENSSPDNIIQKVYSSVDIE